jgi:hypothetical protein
VDTSILKTGALPPLPTIPPLGINVCRIPYAGRWLSRKRFSGVLGMLSSLEVKVLRST